MQPDSTTPNPPHLRNRSRATWHRKASKPVSFWMLTLIAASLIHWALPNYRWVLIHMFTLGIITNSIVLWSQHFTEKFLHQPLPESARPWQLRRIAILNLGIIITLAGQLLHTSVTYYWYLTAIGAVIVSVSLAIHAAYLALQYRNSRKTGTAHRYGASVISFICSAAFLSIGTIVGVVLARELASPLKENLLLSHLVLNILGFIGCAAIGALMLLFPAVWRTQAHYERPGLTFSLLVTGTLTAAIGAGLGYSHMSAAGLAIYIVGLLIPAGSWARCVQTVLTDPRDRITFAAASVLCAPLWLIGSLTVLTYRTATATHSAAITLPTMAFLVGFAAQLLIGVMSYLLPTTIGGGPNATRTGLTVYDRAGLFRSTLLNVGLAAWLYTDNSWLRIVLSILAMGSLAVFVVLSPLAVRAQLGVIRKNREPLSPATAPKLNQITAGLATLALVIAAFGGLVPTPSTPVTTGGTGKTTTVDVSMMNMSFSPNVLEIPVGNQLVVNLRNDDDQAHDLAFDNGVTSGRINPGAQTEITVGVITTNMAGWCTIAGHRMQGMELHILVTGAETETTTNPAAQHKPTKPINNGSDDSLAPVTTR